MPARSKTQRKEILTSLYHFCHFNIGKDGKWNGKKLPNYEANIGDELREAVSTMGVEEWVEEANKAIESYNKTRKEEKETAEGKQTDPMNYPTAPLPPDYNEPRQTAIDFDGSDWQRAIVKIADILEERQECKSSTNVYRWLRKLLEEFGVYKRDEELLEAREATICWYASQIAGNSPYPEFNG